MDNQLLNRIESLSIVNDLPSLHDSIISGLAKLPNSNHIMTSSIDKTLIKRNYKTNELIKRLNGHSDSIYCLCHLSDGRIATGSKDHTIRIWNLQNEDYNCEKILYGHKGSVAKITELQKGIILTSGIEDKCIRIWKINRQNPLLMIMILKLICYDIALYKRDFFLHGEGPLIKLFNWKNKTTIKVYKGHLNTISKICIIQENILISTSFDIICRLWIIFTGECIRQFSGNSITCSFLQISNEIFAIGYLNGEVKFWDINQKDCLNTIQNDKEPVFCFLRLDEQTIVCAGKSKNLTILQLYTWNLYADNILTRKLERASFSFRILALGSFVAFCLGQFSMKEVTFVRIDTLISRLKTRKFL